MRKSREQAFVRVLLLASLACSVLVLSTEVSVRLARLPLVSWIGWSLSIPVALLAVWHTIRIRSRGEYNLPIFLSRGVALGVLWILWALMIVVTMFPIRFEERDLLRKTSGTLADHSSNRRVSYITVLSSGGREEFIVPSELENRVTAVPRDSQIRLLADRNYLFELQANDQTIFEYSELQDIRNRADRGAWVTPFILTLVITFIGWRTLHRPS